MNMKIKEIILFVAVLFLAASSNAEKASKAGVESLNEDLRLLLQKEMLAIDSGMKEIVSASAAGDYEKVSSIARQIKDSFILQQNLTKHQQHQLHMTLSSDFIKQDQNFHYMAGMLEHAAKNQKPELIGFYYSKLIGSCMSCHEAHARHKFPKFGEATPKDRHHH